MAEMQFLQEQKLPCRLPAAFHGDRGFAPLQQIPNPHRADGGLGCGLEESASLTSAFVACSWCMVHGAWCMVHGAWCMVHGAWCDAVRNHTPRCVTHRSARQR